MPALVIRRAETQGIQPDRNKDQSEQGIQHRFRESPLSCNLQRKFREGMKTPSLP